MAIFPELLGLGLLGIILISIISALPLYFAVKFLGGKATIIKVILVNIVVGLLGFLLNIPLIGFILLLLIYKELFELSWVRAFLAWVLQFVVAVILILCAIILLGIALF
ncbi:MAG: hypothetical protein KAT91_04405 [Candidatus Aenigmarchaeota archaeon]|nr:hypothetical protein [Candidatus Aenigmarchaeota archaeon]